MAEIIISEEEKENILIYKEYSEKSPYKQAFRMLSERGLLKHIAEAPTVKHPMAKANGGKVIESVWKGACKHSNLYESLVYYPDRPIGAQFETFFVWGKRGKGSVI